MIGVIDYGLGNIKAFVNLYNRENIPVKVISKPKDFVDITKLILPGVGAFDHAMGLFNNSGLKSNVQELVLQKRVPVLGICVGLQIMAEKSDEGSLSGLGWIKAVVEKIPITNLANNTHLPHMGWNTILPKLPQASSLFNSLPEGPKFYFLHSYFFNCKTQEDSIATTDYGIKFTSAIQHNNISGVQFHPEKSHGNGVKVLTNFWKI